MVNILKISIFFLMLFLPCFVFAYNDFTPQDFEGAGVIGTNNNSYFYYIAPDTAGTISSYANCYEGKCLKMTGNATYNNRLFKLADTALTPYPDYLNFKFYIETLPQAGEYFRIGLAGHNFTSAIEYIRIDILPDGKIYFVGDTTIEITTATIGEWLDIKIYYTSERARILINNSDTDYQLMQNSISYPVRYFYLHNSSGSQGVFYFDNIEAKTLEVDIIDQEEWQGNIQIGAEIDVQYNKYNFCYLGINNPCYLKFNFGFDVIGQNVFLLKNGNELIATSTIENNYLLQDRFLIAEPAEEESQQYCLVLIDDDNNITSYCDIVLDWLDNTYCNEAEICSDIATSSEFFYGFNCGFRKTTCWLLYPSDSSIDFFSKTITNFESSFPFNLTFDFINSIENAISTTTIAGASFGLPMYSSTTDSFYMINGINENSFNDSFGATTTEILETYSNYIIYFFVSLLIAIIIFKYAF